MGSRSASSGTFRRAGATLAGCLLIASTGSACFAEPSALPTVRDFLIAWEVENYEAAARHTTGDPRTVAAALGQIREQLDAASMRLGLRQIKRLGNSADAAFEVLVDLGENGEPWNYSGLLHLQRIGGRWKVLWSPSVINPKLTDGYRLAVVTESQPRAPVQDAAGRSLLRTVDAQMAGVFPDRLRDRKRTLTQLAEMTELDAERLIGRVGSAPPQEFLPLLTLQQPEHSALAARLRRIEGLEFKPMKMPLAPAMAPELVGRLGPATAEGLQQVGAPYQPGDTIGVSGLQLLYQRRMAGIPAVKVVAQDPLGRQTETLAEWRGTPSEPVRTTLDQRIQLSAENALRRLRVPASLTAVNAPTGRILAVANHRTRDGENLAFEGEYPPGMTFSIVSSEPLLQRGQQLGAPAPCPASSRVGDTAIRSSGRHKSTFQANFATSCATAFAALGGSIDGADMVAGAKQFGIGGSWGVPVAENGGGGQRLVPVPAFPGSIPQPVSDTEKALAMIGEGKVRMSPLAMALVAGAVDAGTWRPPQLLNSPEPTQLIAPQPLDGSSVQSLNSLMRQSVQYGAARSANLRGTPVRGVTAVVKYTEGGRQKVVSWFVGSRGDVAFALAIEGKVSAAQVAKLFMSVPPRFASR